MDRMIVDQISGCARIDYNQRIISSPVFVYDVYFTNIDGDEDSYENVELRAMPVKGDSIYLKSKALIVIRSVFHVDDNRVSLICDQVTC